jgi:hypothetical protein
MASARECQHHNRLCAQVASSGLSDETAADADTPTGTVKKRLTFPRPAATAMAAEMTCERATTNPHRHNRFEDHEV